jgi:nitroalkane oxidase
VCRTSDSGPPEKAASIIAVERPADRLVFERAINPVGHRAHLLPQFRFDDVFAPRANLLGEQGGGFALDRSQFHRRRGTGWHFRRGSDAGSV